MDIPAPTPLASRPTVALGCLDGFFPSNLLRATQQAGFTPVFLHRLATEVGGPGDGPREMLAATMRSIEPTDPCSAWGAGCVVRMEEEAALFATAGYTWFTFDLAGLIDDRAHSMSLDRLDAAIVALEDSGCYAPGWHGNYLDREWLTVSGRALRLEDEAIARAAVKFGPALAHADQLHQAIRTVWTGRGEPPDIELSLAARRTPFSSEEFLFLALEAARRGLSPSAIAPPIGAGWQPGAEFAGDTAAAIGRLGEAATLSGSLKLGVHFADGKPELLSTARAIPGVRLHLNFEEATWREHLGKMADSRPEEFREWLRVAQEVFPFAIGDTPLAISEEDTHALPQVTDSALRETFLGHVQGRQLLLVTFCAVRHRRAEQILK